MSGFIGMAIRFLEEDERRIRPPGPDLLREFRYSDRRQPGEEDEWNFLGIIRMGERYASVSLEAIRPANRSGNSVVRLLLLAWKAFPAEGLMQNAYFFSNKTFTSDGCLLYL